jgi:hypothetical protein
MFNNTQKQKQHNQKPERFLLYIPPELLEELRNDAQENFRTVSGQVNYILQQYYSRRKAEPEKTN